MCQFINLIYLIILTLSLSLSLSPSLSLSLSLSLCVCVLANEKSRSSSLIFQSKSKINDQTAKKVMFFFQVFELFRYISRKSNPMFGLV